jgi:putative membrane protein
MSKLLRFVGTYLGIVLAAWALPDISVVGDDRFSAVAITGILFTIVNQLIHAYPSEIRRAPAVLLLILAGIGIVQDTLLWFLASWVGGKMGFGLHVDGFLAALLGGVLVRVVTLLLMAVGPAAAEESGADAESESAA